MFLRIVYQSFLRQRRRKLLTGISIALGVSVATAMIAVATDIGDKINRELRSYGANLVVFPEEDTLDVQVGNIDLKPVTDGAWLNEADLPRIRGTFWRHNIEAFAPVLPVPVEVGTAGGITTRTDLLGTWFAKRIVFDGEPFSTGIRATNPWWRVRGTWPADESENVLAGETLATRLGLRPGDSLTVGGRRVIVTGILSTGGKEDDQVVGPLSLAQRLVGRPGVVRRVFVSALTKPEDELSRRDPKTLSKEMFDRWYCSPYVQSIAFQLEEAIPHSRAEQIRQVAQNEGKVLSRIEGLMLLMTIAALVASALAVSAAMATAIMERQSEVGLMKALGAGNGAVAALLLTEAALLALLAGSAGFGVGSLLAERIGVWVFASRVNVSPVLFPIVLGMAVVVTVAGSAGSIRKAMRCEPTTVLRGSR
jgi:putative ABC transport system permease protein